MEIAEAVAFARAHRWSVLTTIRRNGRPQLSSVCHSVGADGLIRVSFSASRAKHHNLRRDPWAALHVHREDYSGYVVLEAEADLSHVVTSPDDPIVGELEEHYKVIMGDHPDWEDFRAGQARERRVIVRLRPTHAYGMLVSPR